MSISYAVLVLKPMIVGRGESSEILEHILQDCGGQASLRLFREWIICSHTLQALCETTAETPSPWYYPKDLIASTTGSKKSWCLLFTGATIHTNPRPYIKQSIEKWLVQRHRAPCVGSDIYLVADTRADYEATLLFQKFDPELL